MRKIATALFLVLLVGLSLLPDIERSRAGITCTLPNNLQNGTVADATQVMANFNTITGCFSNNIAASGANNDITGLFALTTALAPVNGGTPIYIGSNSTGSANAQVVANTTPTNFVLTSGRAVMFVAGLTNNGAMTLNVASTGAVNLFRRTPAGAVAMIGGEVVANSAYIAVYDGTQWQLLTRSQAKTPTTQRFISGSAATYTTPAGATWIEVTLQGAGGGGQGPASVNGTAGGATSFSTSSAPGGPANAGQSAAGTNCTNTIAGAAGSAGFQNIVNVANGTGGGGANSFFGGSGQGGVGGTGSAAVTNSGSGGGGGALTSASANTVSGVGGAAGAYCYVVITAPAATYTYTVGTGGTGGAGSANGTGGDGLILVVEHYGS